MRPELRTTDVGMSTSAAKEPGPRAARRQNRGIMRFALAHSSLAEAFAIDVDTKATRGA